MTKTIWRLVVLCLLMPASAQAAGPVDTGLGLFEAGDYVDLTKPPYNADNTGRRDASAALRQAFDDYADLRRAARKTFEHTLVQTIYLPDGVYRFDEPVIHGNRRMTGEDDERFISHGLQIVGQSREGTIIRVPDNSRAFADASNPKQVLSFLDAWGWNSAMNNSIENVTIDVGRGNPGAVALEFVCNNTGYIRHVTIRSSDPQGAGAIGLKMEHEAGGIGLIQDLRVEGFDRGISVAGTKISYPFERIELVGQRQAGLYNRGKPIPIRQLRSENRVPAIVMDGRSGNLSVLESELLGGEPGQPAIRLTEDCVLLARDVQIDGYDMAVEVGGKPARRGSHIDEFVYDRIYTLFDDTPRQTLNLPIAEPPTVPWGEPGEWAIVDLQNQDDDTAAIQRALDSGKAFIYVKRGSPLLSDTLRIGGKVQRLHFGFSRFEFGPEFQDQHKPLLHIVGGDGPAVMIQGITSHNVLLKQPWWVQNDTDRTVVIRDAGLGIGLESGVYRHTKQGDLFLTNVNSGGARAGSDQIEWLIQGQNVWARGFNPENHKPNLVNDGGQVWVLGFKFGEGSGPYAYTMNNGRTELFSGLLNSRSGSNPPRRAMLVADHADVSATVAQEGKDGVDFDMGPDPLAFRVYRGAVVAEMDQKHVTRRPTTPGNTANVALFRAAASVPGRDVRVGIRSVQGETAEGAAEPAVFEVVRDGSMGETLHVRLDALDIEDSSLRAGDLQSLPETVTIPAGDRSARFTVAAIDDDEVEDKESLRIYVIGGENYLVDPLQWYGTLSIADNEVDLMAGLGLHLDIRGGKLVDERGGASAILPEGGVRFAEEDGRTVIRFDGKDGIVHLSEGTDSKFDARDMFMHESFSTRSVAMWVKPESLDGTQTLFQQGGTANSLAIRLQEGQVRVGMMTDRLPEPTYIAARWPGRPGQWHHVTVVYSQPDLRLYIDGRLAAQTTYDSGPKAAKSSPSLGATTGGDAFREPGAHHYHGSLADVRIYDRALSDAEVAKLQ